MKTKEEEFKEKIKFKRKAYTTDTIKELYKIGEIKPKEAWIKSEDYVEDLDRAVQEGKSLKLTEVREKIDEFFEGRIEWAKKPETKLNEALRFLYIQDWINLTQLLSQLGLEEIKEHNRINLEYKKQRLPYVILKEKGLKRIDGDAQSIAEFGIDLILDNIDKKEKGLCKCGHKTIFVNGEDSTYCESCGNKLELDEGKK